MASFTLDFTVLALSIASLVSLHAASEHVALTRDGKPLGFIAISTDSPDAEVDAAAQFLRQSLQAISGAELPVEKIHSDELAERLSSARQREQTPILLGKLASLHLEAKSPLPAEQTTALTEPSTFVISATPEVIAITGGSGRGTAIGVDAFLEQLGMRWFFPGKWGTVIPSTPNVSVREQFTWERPSFAARQFQLRGANDWKKHQRTGGLYFGGTHGIDLGPAISAENHPELFALVKGRRQGPQVCLSNPETLKLAVGRAKAWFKKHPESPWYGMGPDDRSGFCECPQCRALDGGDFDPFSGEPAMTDRYVWFFNQVLAALKPDYPGKKIAFYIYHSYMRPPVKVKPDSLIAGAIAPIALCRIHGMNNPICPERSYLKQLIAEWRKLLPDIYERGYWFNLADPGMLFVQTSRLTDEIGIYASQGIQGFRVECLGNWAVEGPSLYMAGRLMWNAKADSKTLLHDYCEKLFGPASAPMEHYFTLLDERLRDSDEHDGSAFGISAFYPPVVREEAGQFIAEAEKLATTSPYHERVEIFAQGFQYAEAFARMREAQAKQDWSEAQQQLHAMDEGRERLLTMWDAPMLNISAAKSYLDRFYRLPVEQGFVRSQGGNQIVALRDTWDFLIDPKQVGEDLGYQRGGPCGGNWQPISAWTKTWGESGLRYYKGLAWYRQEVDIPETWKGKRIFLWFGGVDESARVWVNDQWIGNSPASAFTPFELDATAAIRPGRNTLAVCVANLHVDELGSGGLTAPAFFYAPALGEKATLENVRPLRSTFP